ncbi:MAG: hypothetical protein JNL05_01315 [Flavobacteriales bacterium]|nr:hypothetical protein [Flavobacteriales bacterium]
MKLLTNPWFLLGIGLWQLVVVFTPVSLYGFWSDVVFFVAWLLWSTLLVVSGELRPKWMQGTWAAILSIVLALSIIFTGTLGALLMTSEFISTRSVPQAIKLQGVFLVNQYFTPTGAIGCGMGQLTTVKAFVLFPIVEYRTEYDPCIHEDYGCFIEKGSWEACGY